MSRPRIAVISPFIDKRHGTERRVAEWLSRLAGDYEIHVYSQRVEDLDLSKIVWHRIPRLPGPHLVNYLWWFAANHFYRWWDRRFRGVRHDLVFTPGINCLDADVISVHIVFAEFYRQVVPELQLRHNRLWLWPRLIHRRLYYGLAVALERRIYTNTRKLLVLIARKTANDLRRFYGRVDSFPIVYLGLDQQQFNPGSRRERRQAMRGQLQLTDSTFVLLLIGNDWKKKGLRTLIEAMARLKELPVCLLVVGQDDRSLFRVQIQAFGLEEKVRFLPPHADVGAYYAAADAYVGPSLEDTFAQPPAEAMACGLPVITTITNGTAEIITDGVDGLLLNDPTDAGALAQMIARLYYDPALREGLGQVAARTASRYTWDHNAEQLDSLFRDTLLIKNKRAAEADPCGAQGPLTR
jgi:UDP-glucose:(heptosyl)LPS alpha-1,3-glucosyltransferase